MLLNYSWEKVIYYTTCYISCKLLCKKANNKMKKTPKQYKPEATTPHTSTNSS